MKKSIIALILSIIFLMCMTACSELENSESGNPPSEQGTVYDKIEAFADIDYQEIKLAITTDTAGIQLSANYTLTQNDVSYIVEKLNLLPPNGDITSVPPEYKNVHMGYAKIVDGKVTELDGEEVTLPSYDELKGNFNFDESNFKNVSTQDGFLSADVISPSSFYGFTVDIQDMSVSVEYTETALSKITINYKTEYSNVAIAYVFII